MTPYPGLQHAVNEVTPWTSTRKVRSVDQGADKQFYGWGADSLFGGLRPGTFLGDGEDLFEVGSVFCNSINDEVL